MSSAYEMVQSHIKEALSYLYTSLPAVVTEVAVKGTSTVINAQPLISRVSQEGYVDNEPILENVLVQWPEGGGFRITCPIEVGDTVMLHFTMRGAMEFKNSDGADPVVSAEKRLHSLPDAFAVPTKLTYSTGKEIDPDAMSMGSDTMEIRITKEGTIELGRDAAEKLVLGDTFLALYNALSVPTGVGPSGPPITPMDASLHLSQKVTTL